MASSCWIKQWIRIIRTILWFNCIIKLQKNIKKWYCSDAFHKISIRSPKIYVWVSLPAYHWIWLSSGTKFERTWYCAWLDMQNNSIQWSIHKASTVTVLHRHSFNNPPDVAVLVRTSSPPLQLLILDKKIGCVLLSGLEQVVWPTFLDELESNGGVQTERKIRRNIRPPHLKNAKHQRHILNYRIQTRIVSNKSTTNCFN